MLSFFIASRPGVNNLDILQLHKVINMSGMQKAATKAAFGKESKEQAFRYFGLTPNLKNVKLLKF